jgi:hypothetical protein
MPAYAFDEDCVKDHSQAWCLLDLAGYSKGARDIKVEKANEIIAKASANANPADARSGIDMGNVVLAGMDYAKLTHLPPGVSSGFSGSMWLLGAFLNGPKAGERTQSFVILPESDVKDGDPLTTAEDAFVAAVLKYLEADGAEKVDEERNPPLGSRYTIRAYKVNTGKCAAVAGGCWITGAFFSCSNCSFKKPMVIDKSPEWLGDGRTYVWGSWSPQIREADSKGKPIFPYEKLNQDLRVLLPDWFYLYRPGELSLLFNGQNTRLLAK